MRVTILQTYLYIIVDIVYYKNMCDHVYTCIGIKLQIHIPSRQSNVAKVRRFSIAMSDHSRVVNCGKHNSKPSPK